MSLESLCKALTSAAPSFSDAYLNFEKECSRVVKIIKKLVNEGFDAAWEEFNNPSDHKALDGLKAGIKTPEKAWVNGDGEWERIEFKFESAEYRLIDVNYHPNAYSVGEKLNSNDGMVHWLTLERIEMDGRTTQEGSVPGSLFACAIRAGDPSNEVPINVAYSSNRSYSPEVTTAKLHKFGDAYAMKIGDLIFIQKSNGQVQIENSTNGFKINADKQTSDKFTDLINKAKANQGVSAESLEELVASAKTFELFGHENPDMKKDLVSMHRMFSEFEGFTKADSNSVSRSDRCVEFLLGNPEHLSILQNIFPLGSKDNRLSTGDKYLAYSEACNDLSTLAKQNKEGEKARLFGSLQSNLSSFFRALDILDKVDSAAMNLQPSWVNKDGEWEKMDEIPGLENYRVIDLAFDEKAEALSESSTDKGIAHQLVFERITGEANHKQIGKFTGSLFAYAFEVGTASNAVPMNVVLQIDGAYKTEESKVANAKLCKFGDFYVIKLHDLILIQKKSGEVQIENSKTGLKINADEATASMFGQLIENVSESSEVSSEALMELLTSAKQFLESLITPEEDALELFGDTSLSTASQMNKDLAESYKMYAEFVASVKGDKDKRAADNRVESCVNYLKTKPEYLDALRKMLPLDDDASMKGKGKKYLSYLDHCSRLAKVATGDNEDRKSQLYMYTLSALNTFMCALILLKTEANIV